MKEDGRICVLPFCADDPTTDMQACKLKNQFDKLWMCMHKEQVCTTHAKHKSVAMSELNAPLGEVPRDMQRNERVSLCALLPW